MKKEYTKLFGIAFLGISAVAVATFFLLSAIYVRANSVTTKTMEWGPFTVPAAMQDGPGMLKTKITGIEKPCEDCYIHGMLSPDLVYKNSDSVNFSSGGMLHHLVLINSARKDAACGTNYWGGSLGERFFASGNERTSVGVDYASNYGYYNPTGSTWTMVLDLMNMAAEPADMYIRLTFTYSPGTSANIKHVTPVWVDQSGCGNSKYSVPAGYSDAHNHLVAQRGGEIVWAHGHVHDYGISVSLRNVSSGKNVCTSIAGFAAGSPWAPVGPGSGANKEHPSSHNIFFPGNPDYAGHIEDMTKCVPKMGFKKGDILRLHTQYNTPVALDDAMGIIIVYAVID